ncbi:BnaA06g11640D [Brassica napus]|uniref:BnaA06g11640D protein n=1 Tax=Brassica napus TaxID=3708 RepID=A0A078GNP0_BRANA|nr:BnaA06g11640D [Brassica napus]
MPRCIQKTNQQNETYHMRKIVVAMSQELRNDSERLSHVGLTRIFCVICRHDVKVKGLHS